MCLSSYGQVCWSQVFNEKGIFTCVTAELHLLWGLTAVQLNNMTHQQPPAVQISTDLSCHTVTLCHFPLVFKMNKLRHESPLAEGLLPKSKTS